jgi:hypothetical protein
LISCGRKNDAGSDRIAHERVELDAKKGSQCEDERNREKAGKESTIQPDYSKKRG